MLKARAMRTFALLLALCAVACQTSSAAARPDSAAKPESAASPETAPKPQSAKSDLTLMPQPMRIDQPALVAALVQKYGEASRPRAERGVKQVAAYWRAQDGNADALREFVTGSFVADEKQQDALLTRFSAVDEQIGGHLLEIGRALRSFSELELGPQMDVDPALRLARRRRAPDRRPVLLEARVRRAAQLSAARRCRS